MKFGAICCKEYDYLDGDFIGISAVCDDGSSVEFKVEASPTWADVLGIEAKEYRTFKELKSAVLEAACDRELEPDARTRASLTNWLKQSAPDYLEEWYERTDHISSEYTPGFDILDALSDAERKCLNFRYGDLGGPASSVRCVLTTATIDELNRVLTKRNLPYLFVDAP